MYASPQVQSQHASMGMGAVAAALPSPTTTFVSPPPLSAVRPPGPGIQAPPPISAAYTPPPLFSAPQATKIMPPPVQTLQQPQVAQAPPTAHLRPPPMSVAPPTMVPPPVAGFSAAMNPPPSSSGSLYPPPLSNQAPSSTPAMPSHLANRRPPPLYPNSTGGSVQPSGAVTSAVSQPSMSQASFGEPVHVTDLPCGYDGFVRSGGQLAVHQTQFNCHPSFMRLTVNSFPSTQALAARIKLPLGVLVRPMADTQPGDEAEIPVVGPSNAGVVRCKNCRTYINPYVKFLDGGRRWSCNICGRPNEVPGDYFCNLDAQGLRKDRMERPELSCGICVEYVAPQDYMSRPPQPPVYMFVLDASQRAVTSGLLFQTCVAIKENLQHLRGNERTKVGIIAYNNCVHFFPCKIGSTFKQLVVSDIADILLPQPDDLLVSLVDCKEELCQLLEKLPSMFSSTTQDGAFGAAIKGAVMCMQHLGGKLIATVSHTPVIGEGCMKMREDGRSTDPAREAALLQPQSDFYKNFAVDSCSKITSAATSSQAPAQAPWIWPPLHLCHASPTGSCCTIPAFDGNRDGIQLRIDLNRMVSRSIAFEAVMRIRCTKGVKVNAFYGNFFFKSNDLLATPTNDCDKAFCAELEYEEAQLAATQVHVQSALLYTTSNGERRIRVHNLNIPVSANPAEVYASADCEALATFFGRQAADLMSNAKVQDGRIKLQQAFIDVVKSHRAAVQQMALPPPFLASHCTF
jgi:protein transport protein SEC24